MPKKLTTEDFINKSKQIYGDKFSYEKSIYEDRTKNIIITCKIHGDFLQKPIDHLRNVCGCSMCAGRGKQLDTKTFIEKSKLVHGDLYDYSLVNYKKWNIKVDIICKTHGKFSQYPNGHLFKHGCPKCKNIKTSIRCNKGLNNFIINANNIHNLKYDYSETSYKSNNSKIKIICKKHGYFYQIPKHHLNGSGCPKCSKIVSIPESEFLNYLKIPNNSENRQKYLGIGKIKVDGIIKNKIFEFLGDFWHGNPRKYNSNDIHPITKIKYKKMYKKTFDRFKKLISKNYTVYYIWESDWNDWLNKKIKTFPIKKFNIDD